MRRVRPVPAAVWLIVATACGSADEAAAPAAPATPATGATAQYVGAARCGGCHAAERDAWSGSHHDRALEEASEETLLGDFADARFEHAGALTTFSRHDGRFVVNAEGPDGTRTDYEVAYSFGFDPLQQLLVPLPGGRLQALSVAWDSRPREAGGQRWFDLQPDEEAPPGDPLHWTQLAYNWNSQCADCHSTNLRRGYDPERNTFATTWSDPDVACEACHGPGSEHVAWAEQPARGRTGGGGADAGLGLANPLPRSSAARWSFAPGAPIARRAPARTEHAELETCAPCHARRSSLREGWRPGEPLLDAFRPALLDAELYEADGQIRGEVYEYGSFLQSPMYAAGVSCGDCHDPHSLALRAEGNALCASCHAPDVFDTAAHHRHERGSAGARCASCHMPARTYMGVDLRHDHSFRVPRPDLSVSLGTPNACSDCHRERPAQWAADAVRRWFPSGRSGAPHYAEALHAGRRGDAGSAQALAQLASDRAQPGIVRASALALLRGSPRAGRDPTIAALRDPTIAALRDPTIAALRDPDPLVRLGALEAAADLEPSERLIAAAPLLRDGRRAVRLAAATALAELPAPLWTAPARSALAAALAEYRAAQLAQAERPESHLNLGALAASFGEWDEARREYETALRLAPWFVPALVNLADLERAAGREAEAEALLRRALALAPEQADVHYALGLALVRSGRHGEARPALERAAALAPDSPRYALARALILREQGDRAASLRAARAMLERWPDDADARALLDELERAAD